MNHSPTQFDGVDEPAPIPRRSAESAPTAASAPSAVPEPSADIAPPGPEGREVSGTPEGTPEPSGTWQRVAKAPAAATDLGPVQDAGLPDAPPPMPRLVKIVGLVAVGVLLVLAAWLGLSLGSGNPTASPSQSIIPGDWALTPPTVVGDLVRGEETTTQDPADPDRVVIRANYSDGADEVILLLARPETDIPSFLLEAGVSGITATGASMCGTSVDTGSPVCAQVVDLTGIMVLGLSDQSASELDAHVEAFHAALTGG